MNARFVTSALRGFAPALATVALAAMVSTSGNAAVLVTNGSFSTTTHTTSDTSFQLTNSGTYGTVAGWSNTNGGSAGSYNFLMQSGGAGIGQYGNVSLYGTPAGNLSGPPVSPDGGNFMAMDSDFQDSAIQQTIGGLIAGDKYTVSFYWAATQQVGFSGDTHETMNVTLGSGATQSTAEITNDPSRDFTGWESATMTFTATGGAAGSTVSDVLSFMAVGGANHSDANVPSFALLDGVTMSKVPSPTPEPSSLVLLGSGLAGLAGMVRARFTKNASSAV